MTRVYEELVDFIAGGTTPDNVVAFHPSQAASDRVEELIRRKKSAELPPEDVAELEMYLQLEHLLRLAKARAHLHMAA